MPQEGLILLKYTWHVRFMLGVRAALRYIRIGELTRAQKCVHFAQPSWRECGRAHIFHLVDEIGREHLNVQYWNSWPWRNDGVGYKIRRPRQRSIPLRASHTHSHMQTYRIRASSNWKIFHSKFFPCWLTLLTLNAHFPGSALMRSSICDAYISADCTSPYWLIEN